MAGEKITSFGLNSSSLPYYLATFMSIESEEIIIISPFISQFSIPPIDKRFTLPGEGETTFFGAIASLSIAGVRINIFTTEGYVRKIVEYLDPLSQKVHIKIVQELHEKFFITSNFFYKGSANLTYSGLYENIENCEIGLVDMNEGYIKSRLQEVEHTSKNVSKGMK
jgi:hypothetical protein